jgi:hypothetical protein
MPPSRYFDLLSESTSLAPIDGRRDMNHGTPPITLYYLTTL